MITRCSDTLFPSGILFCTVHICIFPDLVCLLAPLDLSYSLCCKNLKKNNDHFHQLHLQLPTLCSTLLRVQVEAITRLWVALNKQAEQHPWLTCSNTAGERQPVKSLVTQSAGHCCVLAGGGRGIKNQNADDWFRETTVSCQKPVTAALAQDDESNLKGYSPSLSLFLSIPSTWRAGQWGTWLCNQPLLAFTASCTSSWKNEGGMSPYLLLFLNKSWKNPP